MEEYKHAYVLDRRIYQTDDGRTWLYDHYTGDQIELPTTAARKNDMSNLRNSIKATIQNAPQICNAGKTQLTSFVSELLKQLTGKDLNYVAPLKPTRIVPGQVFSRDKQLYVVTAPTSDPVYRYVGDMRLTNPFTGTTASGVRFTDQSEVSQIETQGYKYVTHNLEQLAADLKKAAL